MRTENSAIPCRDGCPIQVIPSPSSAKNLSQGTPSGIPVYIRMEEPTGTIGLPNPNQRSVVKTSGAALPVAHEKGRDLRLANILREPAFQVAFVNCNDVIQEITPATPYPTLCDSILPRTFERSLRSEPRFQELVCRIGLNH
jgi:hypothetical protein